MKNATLITEIILNRHPARTVAYISNGDKICITGRIGLLDFNLKQTKLASISNYDVFENTRSKNHIEDFADDANINAFTLFFLEVELPYERRFALGF